MATGKNVEKCPNCSQLIKQCPICKQLMSAEKDEDGNWWKCYPCKLTIKKFTAQYAEVEFSGVGIA